MSSFSQIGEVLNIVQFNLCSYITTTNLSTPVLIHVLLTLYSLYSHQNTITQPDFWKSFGALESLTKYFLTTGHRCVLLPSYPLTEIFKNDPLTAEDGRFTRTESENIFHHMMKFCERDTGWRKRSLHMIYDSIQVTRITFYRTTDWHDLWKVKSVFS